MVTGWALIRFIHVIFAMIWVGGQLTLSVFMIPLMSRKVAADQAVVARKAIGKTFGIFTLSVFLPAQVISGVALMHHAGYGWSDLWIPGYGRTLAAKLIVFGAVLIISGVHGYLQGTGKKIAAHSLALASLAGSLVIVLLAVALASY